MPTNCPVQADAMQSALVYRRAFEDKWFSIESSDEDEADEQPASVDTDAAAAAERHLRRRRHQAHMLRDIGALNFCQSLASYVSKHISTISVLILVHTHFSIQRARFHRHLLPAAVRSGALRTGHQPQQQPPLPRRLPAAVAVAVSGLHAGRLAGAPIDHLSKQS